jgi:phage host-nuclease inhibitor protein Gam
MPVGEPSVRESVVSFLKRQGLEHSIEEEQHCDKVTVHRAAQVAYVSVYNSGKIVIGGKDTPLRQLLIRMKESIEVDGALPQQLLPFEIDALPQTVRASIPECDEVIIQFLEESLRCYRADALLAACFMLGAASEKAVSLLISAYSDAIRDERNRQGFLSRVNSRTISIRYSEFKQSYKSCKSRPTDPVLTQDLEDLIEMAFQSYRITRNEIGHPMIVPHIEKATTLANIAQFSTYLERLYGLIRYFRENDVVV